VTDWDIHTPLKPLDIKGGIGKPDAVDLLVELERVKQGILRAEKLLRLGAFYDPLNGKKYIAERDQWLEEYGSKKTK